MSQERICRDWAWINADSLLRLLGDRVPEPERRALHAECFQMTYAALRAALEQIRRESQRLNPTLELKP